ncbi:nitrite reductase small subunit NirD [Rhizobium sp. SSA_523]|uniref:nitrite reductase small subunit NirD n=1 Tax=Rhizobium sp. SSA_523 TaxID=2952477 RepID=UPI002090AA23|nr:nitrite reductase small subunit NirD [Rhizobium sp. SSA_523]MCO5731676.1 nitrite reductase small subunit NirD [Rhizobium sp. SSA_523]WKC22947.1 nitrite reductase small subunit NirD [Rhizobium sp. SSA_523]
MNQISRNWVVIGSLNDIPRQGARCVENGAMTIAVFRTHDDRIFAIEDKCPHRNGPLSQGIVHGDCVTCPLHNMVIHLATGRAQGADEGETVTFPVRLEGDIIHLGIDF